MSLFADLWNLLDRAERRRLLWLQSVALIMAVSTLAGIAAVLPFFAVLGDPASIDRNFALAWMYRYFHFSSQREFLTALGIALLVLVLSANAINLAGSLAMNRFAHRVGNRFSVALFDEYIHRSHEFHIVSNSATLLNNVVWEVSRGITGVLQSLFLVSTNVVTSLLIMASIVVLNPLIAFAAVAALAGSYGLIYVLARQRLLGNGLLESLHLEERIKTVSETLGAIREIIVMRGQEFYTAKFEESSESLSRAALSTHAISQSPRYILECIVVAGMVGAALLLVNRGGQGLPQLSFLAFAAYRLLPALQQIFHALVRIRGDRVAFNRIADDLRCLRGRQPDGAEQPVDPPAASWEGRPHQDIRLTQVDYRYAADRPLAIRGASLRIAAGATVGLVGPSGCGKTTLVELILGLLAPTAGTVSVDGMIIDRTNCATWQAAIGYVPQQSFLFDASLAENIALATAYEHIDFGRLQEAIRLAQLDEFVKTLPNGYREVIGERGVRLSGGQRQRVGIARALYRRTSVLILDEATNALDGMTENEIMATLEGLRGARTIILIAHRLSTVRQCDSIFALDGGMVVGSGSFEELLGGSAGFRPLPSRVG
jgi:ABC-type multidrug transport system fused ATPase/permease subunit